MIARAMGGEKDPEKAKHWNDYQKLKREHGYMSAKDKKGDGKNSGGKNNGGAKFGKGGGKGNPRSLLTLRARP